MTFWEYLDNRDKRKSDRLDSSDRFWLLTLGMGALVAVASIGLLSISYGVPAEAATLLGTIVGGLLMFMREIVQAIRNFWTDVRTTRMSDQLAEKDPKKGDDGAPSGTPENPITVQGAGPDAAPVKVTEEGGDNGKY